MKGIYKMPDNIQWLFFDLGYTLIDEHAAHEKRIKDCIEYQRRRYGRTFTYEQIYNEMCRASADYRQQFYGAMEALGIEEKTPYPKEFEKPYPQAEHVLKELSKKYSVGIIANQSAGTEDRLKKFGLSQYISICISSAETGYEKPVSRIFALALNKAKCRAQNAVMIGDRLDNDIFPAKKLGMRTVHIKQGFGAYQAPRSDEYKADITVSNLTELLNYF